MRKVRLLAACCHVKDESNGEERVEKNRQMILDYLDRAARIRQNCLGGER